MDDEEGEENGDADNGKKRASPNEDNDEVDKPSKRAKLRKNPNVDTSFLPDREREEEDRRERERLRQEWLKRQEEIKNEEIEITYSFWDGTGHRKSVMVSSLEALRMYNNRANVQLAPCVHVTVQEGR
jgi:protein FAM50